MDSTYPLPLTYLFTQLMEVAIRHASEFEAEPAEIVKVRDTITQHQMLPFRAYDNDPADLYSIGDFAVYLTPNFVLLSKGDFSIGASITLGTIYARHVGESLEASWHQPLEYLVPPTN